MQIQVGDLVEGKVTGLTKFGAFVGLPENKTGMIHISEVSYTYVNDITDFLKEGQEVKCKVIGIDEKGKISLSLKKVTEQQPEKQEFQQRRPAHNNNSANRKPNVWQGSGAKQTQDPHDLSFEDMMTKFKQVSDEKMGDLKRATEGKNGTTRRKK